VRVTVDDPSGRAQLQLTLAGTAGIETVVWTFPPAARPAVEQIATLLSGFLTRGDDCRLRRVGHILPLERLVLPPAEPTRRRSSDPALVPEGERRALQARLARYLAAHPDPSGDRRQLHATAIIPGDADGPELLAITQAELIHVPLAEPRGVRNYPLASVTSVELRGSVLGWHIAWTAPLGSNGEIDTTVVPFPTVAAEACLAVFAALRQALTLLPIEANGPELSVDDSQGPANDEDGGHRGPNDQYIV
jgi:hypothetical protein